MLVTSYEHTTKLRLRSMHINWLQFEKETAKCSVQPLHPECRSRVWINKEGCWRGEWRFKKVESQTWSEYGGEHLARDTTLSDGILARVVQFLSSPHSTTITLGTHIPLSGRRRERREKRTRGRLKPGLSGQKIYCNHCSNRLPWRGGYPTVDWGIPLCRTINNGDLESPSVPVTLLKCKLMLK